MDDRVSLGKRIKELRKARGLILAPQILGTNLVTLACKNTQLSTTNHNRTGSG